MAINQEVGGPSCTSPQQRNRKADEKMGDVERDERAEGWSICREHVLVDPEDEVEHEGAGEETSHGKSGGDSGPWPQDQSGHCNLDEPNHDEEPSAEVLFAQLIGGGEFLAPGIVDKFADAGIQKGGCCHERKDLRNELLGHLSDGRD